MERVKINEPFFTKDRTFYKTLFKMLIVVALQNVISYSVNMIDNVMLGRYSQTALSGAATVNQIFFMVDQFSLSICTVLVILVSQYWGKKNIPPIRTITGIAVKLALCVGGVILILCGFFPNLVLHIFTNSPEIIAEARSYLIIVMWSFVLFIVSSVLLGSLRAVETVRIAFYISIVSLGINAVFNYFLIFGKCGFPELGIQGAAVSTLMARIVEFLIVVIYLAKKDQKIRLFTGGMWKFSKPLKMDFKKLYIPAMFAQVVWGLSVPMQTAILGHLSDNAIAANSVATTFYQYFKVIVLAMSATSSVIVGNSIGRGDIKKLKAESRTLCIIDLCIGIVLGIALFALRKPLLTMYSLNDETTLLTIHLLVILSFVMVSMAYQMPVSFGIIQGGGDTKFTMKMNMISTWGIVMPLSLMAAFWWKLPVELVVLCIQSDQFFKSIPVFIYFRRYTWIKKLTREDGAGESSGTE